MSDALGRLVDRALDAGSGLRPRNAGRFEPSLAERPALEIGDRPVARPAREDEAMVRPAAGPPEPRTRRLPGVEPAPATRSAEVAAEPAAPPPKASDEAAQPVEPRSPRAVGGRPRPAPKADDAEPSPRVELAPEAPAAPRRAEAARSFPAAAVTQTIAGEPPRAPAVPVSTPTHRAEAVEEHPPPAPPWDVAAPNQPIPVLSVAAKRLSDDEDTTADGRPDGSPVRPAQPLEDPLPGRLAVPDASPAWLDRDTRREARPIVHVSIGRIEVRAVTPPAEPPRREAVTPANAPSLEDYLRARNLR